MSSPPRNREPMRRNITKPHRRLDNVSKLNHHIYIAQLNDDIQKSHVLYGSTHDDNFLAMLLANSLQTIKTQHELWSWSFINTRVQNQQEWVQMAQNRSRSFELLLPMMGFIIQQFLNDKRLPPDMMEKIEYFYRKPNLDHLIKTYLNRVGMPAKDSDNENEWEVVPL